MKFWIDAQLPQRMARWLPERFGVEASTLVMLGLRHATDAKIFQALRQPGQVITTKDDDFVELVAHLSPPPQVLWVSCGNLTNSALGALFDRAFPRAIELLEAGEPVVVIGDA